MHLRCSIFRRVSLLATCAAIVVLAIPSDGARRRRSFDCSKRLAKAIQKYERRRYSEARTILVDVKFQCSGHSAMDSILHISAQSLLKLRNSIEARSEFERLIQDFPESPFAEEARFRLGYCSYIDSRDVDRDQKETRSAIRELSDFVDAHPNSIFADSARHYIDECRGKLAEKELLTARFYEKIKKYESAIVYYKLILDEHPSAPFVPDLQLSLAQALVLVSRPAEAGTVLDEIIGGTAPEEVTKKARALKARLGNTAEETEVNQEDDGQESDTEDSP